MTQKTTYSSCKSGSRFLIAERHSFERACRPFEGEQRCPNSATDSFIFMTSEKQV